MARKIKITEFKTKRINKLTGGKIGNIEIPDYPKSEGDDGILYNSFLTKDGKYIGNFEDGWWYVRRGLKVCDDYPHGVALHYEGDELIGYYGYTHRGGQLFKIGDKLFDENYIAKEEDYSKEEWAGFLKYREEIVGEGIREGYFENSEQGYKETPISDVIPFVKRGAKTIETWDEAKQAAINISNYLS